MTLEEASQLLSNWLIQKPVEAAAQKTALERYGKLFHPDNIGVVFPLEKYLEDFLVSN
jgi:hypothetical protein